jgi:hypothetical protein
MATVSVRDSGVDSGGEVRHDPLHMQQDIIIS